MRFISVMSAFHWLVELALPAGSFRVCPILSDRSSAELDLDIHSSVAELLAWKTAAPIFKVDAPCAPRSPFEHPSSASRPRRLMMAHFRNPLLARQKAA